MFYFVLQTMNFSLCMQANLVSCTAMHDQLLVTCCRNSPLARHALFNIQTCVLQEQNSISSIFCGRYHRSSFQNLPIYSEITRFCRCNLDNSNFFTLANTVPFLHVHACTNVIKNIYNYSEFQISNYIITCKIYLVPLVKLLIECVYLECQNYFQLVRKEGNGLQLKHMPGLSNTFVVVVLDFWYHN